MRNQKRHWIITEYTKEKPCNHAVDAVSSVTRSRDPNSVRRFQLRVPEIRQRFRDGRVEK